VLRQGQPRKAAKIAQAAGTS